MVFPNFVLLRQTHLIKYSPNKELVLTWKVTLDNRSILALASKECRSYDDFNICYAETGE
jgi:hypothetical protein